MQNRFRFDGAGNRSVFRYGILDAHQQDRTFGKPWRKNRLYIGVHPLSEFIQIRFSHMAEQLPKGKVDVRELSLFIRLHGIHRAIQIVSDTGESGAVRQIRLGKRKASQLDLQIRNVVLDGTLRRRLVIRIDRRHNGKLRLSPIGNAVFFEQIAIKIRIELFLYPGKLRGKRKPEISVAKFERLR